MQSYMKLILPSGQEVFDGGTIRLGQDSTTYFVKYGSYTCGQTSNCGWYLQAVGTNVCIAVTDELLQNAEILCNGGVVQLPGTLGNCNCRETGSPKNAMLSKYDKYLLNSTYLVLRTVAERDALPVDLVSNGRIVRILPNEASKLIVDYQFDVSTMSWKAIDYTELDSCKALDDKLSELSTQLEILTQKVEQLTESSVSDKLRSDE